MGNFVRAGNDSISLSPQNPTSVWVSKRDATHAGLAYVTSSGPKAGQARILHLINHEKLLDAPEDLSKGEKQYLVAYTGLVNTEENADIATHFANFLGRVMDMSNNQVPYGVDWLGSLGAFDGDNFDKSKGSFTCATFVSAMFNAIGYPVVDIETWDADPQDDPAWREQIIAIYNANNGLDVVTRDRLIAQVQQFPFLIRLKPSQIVACAACHMREWEINYVDAKEKGMALVTEYKTAFK